MELPSIGLGTWELKGQECTEVVRKAIDLGYQHIDTAFVYGNQKAIGEAIKGKEVYLTSKLAVVNQVDSDRIEESVEEACNATLSELGVNYLNLYLIHAPVARFPMVEVFAALTKLEMAGKIGKAGVSNYDISDLEELREAGFVPYANQVELHPYYSRKELVDYCRKANIRLISYRSLGKGKFAHEQSSLQEMGKRHGKSIVQVILRWLVQQGISVIPKASWDEHLKENLAILDFTLTQEEMAVIDALNQDQSLCDWKKFT